MSVYDAASVALDASPHVDRLGADAGAVEALLALARKIDAWDEIVDMALAQTPEGKRPPVPQHDNTSLSTFLKYCEALGLTPATRKALGADGKPEGDAVDELKARRRQKQKAAG